MTSNSSSKNEWLVPSLLILLSVVPILAGIERVIELSSDTEVTLENSQYFEAPAPVVIHIITVSFYCILGALQFSPVLRRRNLSWHRIAGRFLIPCGLVAALSGLWMTQFYPPSENDGLILYWIRMLVGTGMALSICLGFIAIRRREILRHRAWMARGYALGLGAGTQVLMLPPLLLLPNYGKLEVALAMGAGWAINLAVAEWIIRTKWNTNAAVLM
ncbi:MAG: hypothetical protein COB20_16385 [SAR86 cluster bacterium]|uniref:DUF2306 domain-containing protein n=1 Tax=SAR86 cluster bacterium TaxID=2030880 RepID=A0A2A4WSY2_9GAMM|nr:MAG: hypothetical protein COB20_16385 [SAR86 cluster bacterium]